MLRLADQARNTLATAGRRSEHQERGGILFGYREGGDVIVEDALAVGDPTAGHSRYLRRSRPAEETLASYLERFTDSSDGFYLGYVDEWHTHPLPAPPSPNDHAAMRTMARRHRHPVAMVVVARLNETTVKFHGLVSTPETARKRLTAHHVSAPVRAD